MKLDSKYFDMIRIRPVRPAQPDASVRQRCQWKGCGERGEHRAPKGRGQEGQFYVFCQEHARQYNSSYNYFDGMKDSEVEAFQKDALTGHRPTWKVGANAWAHGTKSGQPEAAAARFSDERKARAARFAGWRAGAQEEVRERPGRKLKPLEAKAMTTLGLDGGADKAEVKARFKELVKRHHPDSNGGDRAAEEKLREIIQAYNYLKQAGLV
jgi:curved DNA-binding protein CbpA